MHINSVHNKLTKNLLLRFYFNSILRFYFIVYVKGFWQAKFLLIKTVTQHNNKK